MSPRRESVSTKRSNELTPEEIKFSLSKLRSIKYFFAVLIFLKRVRILEDTGCWIISKDWSNYTSFNKQVAHRFSYLVFVGDILNGNYICHHCDRKGCVNYNHLYQGSPSDNMTDWKLKKSNYLDKRRQDMLTLRDRTGKAYDSDKTIKPWHLY